jgi:hypothetical protein
MLLLVEVEVVPCRRAAFAADEASAEVSRVWRNGGLW